MLTRFELFVILRNQVADRAVVRRSLAVEAILEELADEAGRKDDVATWALAGLGADIDAELCKGNLARRGEVAAELLLTEGAPEEVAAAARTWREGRVEELAPLTAAVAAAAGLADEIYAMLDGACCDTLDTIEAIAVSHRIRRLAERRGDAKAERVIACLEKIGVPIERAAERALEGMRRVREDLRL